MARASVILPTFDRSSTLPFALASVQAQTERAIEIVVVLDGATPACRDIAATAARSDDRIRVMDFAKDAGHGEHNVDLAVSACASGRIFYIDDDDLWLPRHVELLLPCLERADIVDSRICSLDRSGGLNLGPCRGSSAPLREHLAMGRLKMLYDTHIAHRKDAYGRFSSWVAPEGPGDRVWGFLAGFARHPDCKWVSCDEVTAISIHGAARRDMTAAARAAEIAHWSGELDGLEARLRNANSTFHLFRLLMIDPPRGGTLDEYLAPRGGYGGNLSGGPESDVFALFTPSPPPQPVAVALALALSEPVESGYLIESIALTYFNAYGQPGHERILLQAATAEGANQASRLANYSVALCRRDLAKALDVAREALALGPDPVGSLARWAEKLSNSGYD